MSERVEEGVEGGVDLLGCLTADPVTGALDDRGAAEVGARSAGVGVEVGAGTMNRTGVAHAPPMKHDGWSTVAPRMSVSAAGPFERLGSG